MIFGSDSLIFGGLGVSTLEVFVSGQKSSDLGTYREGAEESDFAMFHKPLWESKCRFLGVTRSGHSVIWRVQIDFLSRVTLFIKM